MSTSVIHDGTLWVSMGASRKEKSWKNKEMQWSELVERLQKSIQTSETLKEYQKFTKEVQAEKKDIGGYVGGVVTGGRRKKGSVGTRSLLTLDLDYATGGFWDTFDLYYRESAVLHTTHAHSPEKPRYRLIMPLSRECFADEYEALSRRVAGDLGIDLFDDTTFQPTRLMYWPSRPKDVQYYYQFQDGPWLDVDEVLHRYRNWKDSSQWPISSRAKEIPDRLKKQQGDPHEKPGIIGAFCRSYTIAEVIERYLPDIYDSTDDDDRYTYMQGSAAKGLVIYEDKYAYSHHGTDPISGRLCNAFDLVRLHLYGGQDETVAADTPVNRLPSFTEMKGLATKDEAVRRELAEARLSEAGEAFGGEVFSDLPEDDKKWTGALKIDGSGFFLPTAENILIILANDSNLAGCFQYNSFEDKPICLRDLPWRSIDKPGEAITEDDDACLRNYLEKFYKITSGPKVSDAFREHLVKNSVHPVRDYLESLTWDGKKRIDTLLVDYFGAEDSEYVHTVTRKTFAAAVTRVMRPGCKFDNVLTLISDEGKNKSTFLEKLGHPWFSADFGPLDNMIRAMEQLQGSWIIEIAELHAIKKADMDTVKHFVSKTEDRFRKSYGRRTSFCPRQCIFIATGNKPAFLNEPGRHRRFWPVTLTVNEPTRDVWKQLTAGEVRQIWAEAVQLYYNKETLYLPLELEEEAIRIKDQHIEEDDREIAIRDYLNRKVPSDWDKKTTQERCEWMDDALGERKGEKYMHKIIPLQIWVEVFGKKMAEANPYNMRFIREAMEKNREWKKSTVRTRENGVSKGWIRVKDPVTDQNVTYLDFM